MNRLLRLACSLLILLLPACTPDTDRRPDVSGIPMTVRIRRVERELFALRTKADVGSFLKANPLFADNFLQASQYPDDSALINRMYAMVTDRHLDTLYRQTQTAFADVSKLETDLAQAFRYVKHYYPAFVPPAVYTIVTGFGNDLFVSDSLVVIGLDFFAGNQTTYRPNVPNYLLRRYQPAYLVPSVMTLVSQKYNATSVLDKTLLAEMVFYGKSYEFAKATLPDTPDSLLIGFTGQQLTYAEQNQKPIWAHFVADRLLYATSSQKKVKYVGERPFTPEIGEKCPGSVGRWLGWRIVRAYRQRQPGVTLPQLMANQDVARLFAESNYKGQ